MEPEFLIKSDAAGRNHIRKFRSTTASLHWGDYRGNTLNNGSMFFLFTGEGPIRGDSEARVRRIHEACQGSTRRLPD
jgi:hypothetical protein